MHKHPNQHTSSPFIKWVGGKKRLLPQLLPLLSPGARLIEPFVGAGAVTLATDYEHYVLSDANADLIAVWSALQSNPTEFSERASHYFSEKYCSAEAYNAIRQEFNASCDAFERAVRFIYLNKLGFNGLFRVNQRGHFNVPFGHPNRVPNFPAGALKAASTKLARCTIMCGGFETAMGLAGHCDVVYCDPPYLDSSEGKSFTGYTANGFGEAAHNALVCAAHEAAARGAAVLISNHDTAQTRQLYKDFEIHELQVQRSLSAKVASRGMTAEIVAILRAR